MDRYAIFVDAGYLWAMSINLAVTDEQRRKQLRRSEIQLDHKGLIEFLKKTTSEFARDRELLRVYWYDAAPDRVPTPEHLKIAEVPETKIRIGHLTANGVQKNVDTMLLLDLNALARQNSIQSAIILGGDGDFLEGVITAQALGVKIFLLGIEGETESVSPELKMEVDSYRYLTSYELEPFIKVELAQTPIPVPTTKPKWITIPQIPASDNDAFTSYNAVDAIADDDLITTGRHYAERLGLSRSAGEITALLKGYPTVDGSVHYQLIVYALETFGLARGTQLRRSQLELLRRGFWEKLSDGQLMTGVS